MDNWCKNLVIVDERDRVAGSAKAILAHHRAHYMLHRAFSVMILDSEDRLLLQKRSTEKYVFPGLWANTCCSHPFMNELSFTDPVQDCRSHAVARLKYELGIECRAAGLVFAGRVLYHAMDGDESASIVEGPPRAEAVARHEAAPVPADFSFTQLDFCEHEVDYVFVARMDAEPVPNPHEVAETRWLSREELARFTGGAECSPWLRLILKHIDVFSVLAAK